MKYNSALKEELEAKRWKMEIGLQTLSNITLSNI